MKKLFQNQAVAWAVLILAVALACLWGFSRRDAYESKKSTELLDVKYYEWVNDSAKLLSDTTENTVKEYNAAWNQRYYAVVAVATVPKLNGWKIEDYAAALGEKWGLGAGDMLLLLVKNGDWYAACGDQVLAVMTDTQRTKLKQAIDEPYYRGDFNEAAVAFFRQADVFYAQSVFSNTAYIGENDTAWTEYSRPQSAGHVSLFKVVLLIVAVFVIWALLDRIRYSRYRRRSVVHVGVPAVSYYPIFWGRHSARPAAPYRPVAPSHGGSYYGPSGSGARPQRQSSTFHSAPRSSGTSGASRPAPRPSGTSRPGSGSSRSGGFGKGGFGGGKR